MGAGCGRSFETHNAGRLGYPPSLGSWFRTHALPPPPCEPHALGLAKPQRQQQELTRITRITRIQPIGVLAVVLGWTLW